jgi:hypothetical protein
MPARTITCTECGASEAVADADWAEIQRAEIAAWKSAHKLDVHGGKEVLSWGLDPNPMFDRD